ncbi:hypothetical protein G9A89_021103 [Geosiphon pyriformis]|nr:hypothetical protein G9A89_021103 [Geosiphon pyriformis]
MIEGIVAPLNKVGIEIQSAMLLNISGWNIDKNARACLWKLKFSPKQIPALLSDQRKQAKLTTLRAKA